MTEHRLQWGDLDLSAQYSFTPWVVYSPVVEAAQTADCAFVITTLGEQP